MVTILSKEVSQLCTEEIKDQLSNYEVLSLEKAEIGPQKKDTVIIGELYEVNRRKTQHLLGKTPAIRLKLKEVCQNSNGLRFEVVISGKSVGLIEETFKSKEDSSAWVTFSNLMVVKYTGQEEPWCPFGLKAFDKEENDENKKPEITFFYQQSKSKILPLKYSTLNEICDKKRIKVFVAVTNVIKQPVVLGNNTRHIMLNLIDPSCLEPSATFPDLPLHIFLNDHLDDLPEPIKAGDILRIRDLLGDLYTKENKMFGKVFHSKSIIKFKLREDDDKVTPITSNFNYKLTEQDVKMVKQLRQWWIKNYEVEKEGNLDIDPLLLEKKICEIKSPCIFNLNCLVKDVRIVETHNVVILRVTDGTKSSVLTTTVNLNNATQEFSSQAEQAETANFDSREIDITIFQPLFDKASSLKAGDMVQLIHVKCVDLIGGEEELLSVPILDFYMKDEKCEIRDVYENTSTARLILRTLNEENYPVKDANEQESLTFQSKEMPLDSGSTERESKSSVSLRKSVESVAQSSVISKSPVKPSEDVESSLSPASPRLLQNQEENHSENTLYPALEEKLDLSDSVNGDLMRICNNHKIQNKAKEKINEDTEIEREINDRKITSKVNELEGRRSKRKYCYIESEPDDPKKILSFCWQHQELKTICNEYPKSSLTEFCENSKPGDKCKVWALLKHIHFSSKEPCEECSYMHCYHDWIWGLCNVCGTTLTSSDLRKHYSLNDLTTFKILPCFKCQSKDQSGNFEPFFKLELCLEDVINDKSYSVDLSGDDAELFFGFEATFKWTIDFVSNLFQEKTNLFQISNQKRPFQYCLVKRIKSDGSICIQICNTELEF